MRLARVDHYRCDDIAASTYVWIPDEKDQAAFEVDVARAQEAFLAAGAAAAEHAGPRPVSAWSPGLTPLRLDDAPDSTTVGELRAARAQAQAEWAAWEAKRKAASRPFGSFLADLGYRAFYDIEPALVADLGWGHRHGQALDLDDTAPGGRDLRGLLRHRPHRVAAGRTSIISQEAYVASDPTDPIEPADDV